MAADPDKDTLLAVEALAVRGYPVVGLREMEEVLAWTRVHWGKDHCLKTSWGCCSGCIPGNQTRS